MISLTDLLFIGKISYQNRARSLMTNLKNCVVKVQLAKRYLTILVGVYVNLNLQNKKDLVAYFCV